MIEYRIFRVEQKFSPSLSRRQELEQINGRLPTCCYGEIFFSSNHFAEKYLHEF